jgi:hypothetical protein
MRMDAEVITHHASRAAAAVCRGTAAALFLLYTAAAPIAAGATQQPYRTFATPEDAVRALAAAVKAGNLAEVIAIFAPDGEVLAASSDPATGGRNREVFTAAFNEGWRLVSQGTNRKTLVIGNEAWPFPVPLVKTGARWRFDTQAGKEEVIARRIGRNELAVIAICKTYVAAQQHYASEAHDGGRPGVYAIKFHSDPGRHNGLYWPDARGQKRSPLGDLVAEAAQDGQTLGAGGEPPPPFHGYYFKILTEQGAHAPGGAKSFVVGGEMSDGFALVAWPAQYDATGIMSFVVDRSGVVRQKDLGPDTAAAARAMTAFDPDAAWHAVK